MAICARRSSFSPSKASTISARAAGSEGRFRANRHVGKLHENARNRQQNRAIQQTPRPSSPSDHSRPPETSISIANSPSRASSLRTGGQAKSPSSSHLVARTRPVRRTRELQRSDRFERKMKPSRLAPDQLATSATRPCTAFSKSIGSSQRTHGRPAERNQRPPQRPRRLQSPPSRPDATVAPRHNLDPQPPPQFPHPPSLKPSQPTSRTRPPKLPLPHTSNPPPPPTSEIILPSYPPPSPTPRPPSPPP